MMVDANGNPLVTDAPRSIRICETATPDGKKMWGIDFEPNVGAFEFEEVIMILSDVVRGIAQQARSRVHEARAQQAIRAKLNAIKE